MLRVAGWPRTCDHARDSLDGWWWADYARDLVALSAVGALVFLAWRRSDVIGRWALEFDRRGS
jgi:hypothetical protein